MAHRMVETVTISMQVSIGDWSGSANVHFNYRGDLYRLLISAPSARGDGSHVNDYHLFPHRGIPRRFVLTPHSQPACKQHPTGPQNTLSCT